MDIIKVKYKDSNGEDKYIENVELIKTAILPLVEIPQNIGTSNELNDSSDPETINYEIAVEKKVFDSNIQHLTGVLSDTYNDKERFKPLGTIYSLYNESSEYVIYVDLKTKELLLLNSFQGLGDLNEFNSLFPVLKAYVLGGKLSDRNDLVDNGISYNVVNQNYLTSEIFTNEDDFKEFTKSVNHLLPTSNTPGMTVPGFTRYHTNAKGVMEHESIYNRGQILEIVSLGGKDKFFNIDLSTYRFTIMTNEDRLINKGKGLIKNFSFILPL